MTTLITFIGKLDLWVLTPIALICLFARRKKIIALVKSLFAKKQNETPTDTKS